MTTRVRVGDVEVRIDADLTVKQVRSLLHACAGIAVALAPDEPERSPIGFTVITERESEPLAEPPDYDDEE